MLVTQKLLLHYHQSTCQHGMPSFEQQIAVVTSCMQLQPLLLYVVGQHLGLVPQRLHPHWHHNMFVRRSCASKRHPSNTLGLLIRDSSYIVIATLVRCARPGPHACLAMPLMNHLKAHSKFACSCAGRRCSRMGAAVVIRFTGRLLPVHAVAPSRVVTPFDV